ncbi:alpha,alpha-trehalose-phosphate synthase (UDP-forming) [Trinickia caryophylli]|uniref:Trehalose-6-phosphate synthase n=1 Tax=Trinickia caryophylli TaxID=28094 RepID=A0A1X7GZP0_TRICW|nr:alpha,alpha-trehalose-phosphate synthase (UDP-forming) [Trinickia caryophylli]PMS10098.1 alpha,alpha-trehalose-phosphate synthase (UDP-forming) [Trinickia caryophylli]TRX18195.1 alpha,alpha-trehalose-phosphate synthase (UDP-forming) [Trinickia caryophylli]WQE11015.1 alpha,alpha-trehalose-phosphate synthase (UDP-forming) [Trinickia caryophylli]SMF76934.1 trehalose 6-phosphate synthase [Trinickia caryophylli]GLU35368.1 alpha,alpha-trehalose-phosphate synthase (UDP-forming) [Trinickia caryophy
MSRLIVVSNRVAPTQEGRPAAGGLAIGVLDALRETGGLWFGWSGEIVNQSEAPSVDRQGNVTYVTVGLTRRDYDQYYRGFSNATLWPAFHYRTDLARYDRQEYAGYLRVNASFAKQLKTFIEPGDIIWVHDYHLLPFARALRDLGVTNPIGFFLHIPFPVAEMLRTVPPHDDLVRSMCSYDVVGFQTQADRQAFVDYIERGGFGTTSDEGVMHAFGRMLKVGAYPIGIYPDAVAKAAEQYGDRKPVLALRDAMRERRLIMSVDRLDYSKGLVERFDAFERFLADAPQWHGKVSLVQIAPPTRSDVQTYQRIRQTLEGEAGRVNGRFAQLDWTPIQYLNRKYERNLLMALFRLAHVGFVTPLRDGMNLVAKEYVASQNPDDPGVLVLSQFAGAADEMPGALIVDPFDVAQMAEALGRALAMPLAERRARYADMMARLQANDLSAWRDAFITDLRGVATAASVTRKAVELADLARLDMQMPFRRIDFERSARVVHRS